MNKQVKAVATNTAPARRTALAAAAGTAALALLPGCGNFGARLADSLGSTFGIRGVLQRLGLAPAPAPVLSPARQQALDAHYQRGARALLANDIDATVAAWRDFVILAPPTLALARTVRGHLTLLDREAARRFVQRVAAAEKQGPGLPTDRLHVAVLPFSSRAPQGPAAGSASGLATSPAAGPAGVAAFNRAVAAMIMVDLAKVPSLTLLERDKVELLANELKLGDSALVDPATAARPGRLLGAGTVVAGAVYNEPGPAGPGSGRYRLNAAVSDVARSRLVGQNEAEGKQADFFVLQKRIVHGILDTLEIRDRPAAVDTIHTRSWEAYARFARGLQFLADNRFAEARTAFLGALEIDPAFLMAETAFLSTPERAVTLQDVRNEAAQAASLRP